ncbi:MAG TPA: AMP-binding protein [Steroidobacteraceae bacterium]|jgi:long-chain acyl-CoA synthetase|nr:AMP-binding protein [Steroidobacteraceae bacterium]
MERFWLPQYPPGVAADIDPFEFPSLKALIEDACERYADRIAYRSMGTAITYRQLERLSRAFGAWLQQRAGLKSGDRVALMLPNLLQYPIAMFGALRAGFVVVNVNPLYTAAELEHQLKDSDAAVVVVLENFAATLEQALPDTNVRHVIVTGVGDLLHPLKGLIVNTVLRHVQRKVPRWLIPEARALREVLKQARTLTLQPVSLDHQDLAYLQYTGGTTGVAKGAMLTHGNMVANVLQSRAWFRQKPLEHTTFICALPLYHIFSLTANCLLFSSLGGSGLLIANPRDFKGFIRQLRSHPPMFFMGVNTLFNALLHTPGFGNIDCSRLSVTVAGGMALQSSVAERWFEATGCVITQGWGLTEASPVVCCNPTVGEDAKFNGSVGLPIPSTEVSIRDEAGQDLGIGAVGEICVRGPQVMRGYWQRPEESAQVLLPDGWLRTGDIGRADARGFVFIEDRKKDMIIVSGFKVYPNEIEEVVARCPGVLEVAAVAQPDEHSGEVVALFIVRKDPALTVQAVKDYCHQYLTAYKRPQAIYFRDELPKTNVGKILRRSLRDELAAAAKPKAA